MTVNFPSDGIYGGFYAQGVVKNSPHQACSKLWLEMLASLTLSATGPPRAAPGQPP